MTHSKTRRILVALAIMGALPLLMNGCSSCKKPPPAEDAAPVTTAAVDAGQLDLADLADDGGDDAPDAEDAAKPHGTGVAVDPNVAKIRACCGAMANQAAHLPNGPEKFQLQNAAAVCNGIAASLVPGSPAAAQTAQLRALLAANKLPNLCAL
jgi:hypothetical protein